MQIVSPSTPIVLTVQQGRRTGASVRSELLTNSPQRSRCAQRAREAPHMPKHLDHHCVLAGRLHISPATSVLQARRWLPGPEPVSPPQRAQDLMRKKAQHAPSCS